MATLKAWPPTVVTCLERLVVSAWRGAKPSPRPLPLSGPLRTRPRPPPPRPRPSVEGRGRGGGGRGRGRSGPEKGRGRGDGLAPRRADTTNCSKHVTTVGGQALSVAKLPKGDWGTVQISWGTHEHLAKTQVHINKTWYPPSPVYGEMEPLESRMLYINQSVEKGKGRLRGASCFLRYCCLC